MKCFSSMATLVVVRHGASETFHHLQATWAPKLGPDLMIVWDRRIGEGRRYQDSLPVDEAPGALAEARREACGQRPGLRTPERRQAERRRRAPDSWGTLGFPVVHDEETSP